MAAGNKDAEQNSGTFQSPSNPAKIPGLPENLDVYEFQGFAGINTKPTRSAIGDQQMYWCNNWMPLGQNNLRSLGGIGESIFSAGVGLTILSYAFFNIGSLRCVIVFLSDGSGEIIEDDGTPIFSMAASFFSGAKPPQVAQWGSKYLLIVSQQTNGYWVWDGTVIYGAGGAGPLPVLTLGGSGYGSAPTVSFSGGAGSGITGTATVTNGSVTAVTLTAIGSGYTANDFVVMNFTGGGGNTSARVTANLTGGAVTSVTVNVGGTGYTNGTTEAEAFGGGGTGATFTVTVAAGAVTGVTVVTGGSGYLSAPTIVITDPQNTLPNGYVSLMPIGVKGDIIETYAGHVWIGDGNKIIFSAPNSVSDFGAPNGGGVAEATQPYLRERYTYLKQSNGFLYLGADSSVDYISGVQTASTSGFATTTYTNLNVDPQIGTPWTNTAQLFSRAIVFVNSFGVHALYGGTVEKVSDALDGLFEQTKAGFSVQSLPAGFTPSSAVAVINGIHVYITLLPITDLVTGVSANALVMWDGKRWWTATQEVALQFIASQEIDSEITVWGTDGVDIYPLLETPSEDLEKIVQSKLWSRPHYSMMKKGIRLWSIYEEFADTSIAANHAALDLNISIDTERTSQFVSTGDSGNVVWTSTTGIATWVDSSGNPVIWSPAVGVDWFVSDMDVYGFMLGTTVRTYEESVTLLSVSIGFQQYDMRI